MSVDADAAASSASELPPLAEALRDFAYAVKALQLYPSSSPIVSDAVERAHSGLQPFLLSGRLSLAVLPEGLRIGREEAAAGSLTVAALAERLHQRGVAHLHLDTAVEPGALKHLAELLASPVLKSRSTFSRWPWALD